MAIEESSHDGAELIEIFRQDLAFRGSRVGHIFREGRIRRRLQPRQGLNEDLVNVLERGQEPCLVVGGKESFVHVCLKPSISENAAVKNRLGSRTDRFATRSLNAHSGKVTIGLESEHIRAPRRRQRPLFVSQGDRSHVDSQETATIRKAGDQIADRSTGLVSTHSLAGKSRRGRPHVDCHQMGSI